jgi:hypothetical protein
MNATASTGFFAQYQIVEWQIPFLSLWNPPGGDFGTRSSALRTIAAAVNITFIGLVE